jgi:hypothetical protein
MYYEQKNNPNKKSIACHIVSKNMLYNVILKRNTRECTKRVTYNIQKYNTSFIKNISYHTEKYSVSYTKNISQHIQKVYNNIYKKYTITHTKV